MNRAGLADEAGAEALENPVNLNQGATLPKKA
jgi:hypothetical protein